MDDCLDSLGDAVVFSTFECNSGYGQIPVSTENRDKTTFIVRNDAHGNVSPCAYAFQTPERTRDVSAGARYHP